MKETIEKFVDDLDITQISEDRQNLLQGLFTHLKKRKNIHTNLNFVCTHNSRRSHFAQIWSTVMMDYYNLSNLNSYSSGTEATALFPVVASTLRKQGFSIDEIMDKDQIAYKVGFDKLEENVIFAFSKRFDHSSIPTEDVIAIMVCSDAEKNCPIIPNVVERIAICYEDPKKFDGTELQLKMYEERSVQIAREMKYIFSNI